ncbi:hypothetical protein KPP03845_105622 [Streptomyces xanthophaeus]|nr:hypothetical protein [Streptomyces xanthophaeus]WCD89203.1 hypothetical protein KPP03845_105622 [Streptomyces xanthophaeus]
MTDQVTDVLVAGGGPAATWAALKAAEAGAREGLGGYLAGRR